MIGSENNTISVMHTIMLEFRHCRISIERVLFESSATNQYDYLITIP